MKFFLFFLLALIVAIVSFKMNAYGYISPGSDFELEDLGQQLGILFFLALVLERVQEVIMTSWRGGPASDIDRNVNQQLNAVTKAEKALSESTIGKDFNKLKLDLDGARAREEVALNVREVFRNQTRQRALVVGLVLGSITSLLGFRVLDSIADIDQWKDEKIAAAIKAPGGQEEFTETQKKEKARPFKRQADRLRLFDVLLTGMLLAGGSDGIHKIARALTDFAESSSEKSKKSAVTG